MAVLIKINGSTALKDVKVPLGVAVALENDDNTGLATITWEIPAYPERYDRADPAAAPVQPDFATNFAAWSLGGDKILSLVDTSPFAAVNFVPDLPGTYIVRLTDDAGTPNVTTVRIEVEGPQSDKEPPGSGENLESGTFRAWSRNRNRGVEMTSRRWGWERVNNTTAGVINKGKVVKIDGAPDWRGLSPNVVPSGTHGADVARRRMSSITTQDGTAAGAKNFRHGIVAADIAVGVSGWIQMSGILEGDFSAFTVGQKVFVNATGDLTATATNVRIGYVTIAAVTGAMWVDGLSPDAVAASAALPAQQVGHGSPGGVLQGSPNWKYDGVKTIQKTSDAGTANFVQMSQFTRESTGPTAAGFGIDHEWRLDDDDGNLVNAANMQVVWRNSAVAGPKAAIVFRAKNLQAGELVVFNHTDDDVLFLNVPITSGSPTIDERGILMRGVAGTNAFGASIKIFGNQGEGTPTITGVRYRSNNHEFRGEGASADTFITTFGQQLITSNTTTARLDLALGSTAAAIAGRAGLRYNESTQKAQFQQNGSAWMNLDASGIGGSIASTQLAVGSGVNTIGGFAGLTYISGSNLLNVENITMNTAGSQLLVESGNASAGAPHIAKAGNANTGILWFATNQMQFVAGGVARMTIASHFTVLGASAFQIQVGSLGALPFRYAARATVGFFSNAADSHQAVAGGVACMTWAKSGGVPLVGLYGVTAVAQPAGTGETIGFTQNSGTEVRDDSTFTGNTGATAYNLNDIVKGLKQLGGLKV